MSAPVSAIGNGMQLGVETTEGTAVSAGKKFQSIKFNMHPKIETVENEAQGFYFPTSITPNKDWSEGSIEGRGSYTELAYLFASVLSYAAPTQNLATLAYTWAHAPSVSAANTHKTFTVEQGFSGSGNARKVAGVYVNELKLSMSRASGVEVGGSVVGRQYLKGQTLTATPTLIPFVPILGTQLDLFQDATWAGLGGTKMLDDIAIDISFGNRFSPWWTMNSALASFAAKVNAKPATAVTIRAAANAANYAYLDTIRAGGIIFVRSLATGGLVDTGQNYKLQIDMALSYSDASEESEDDDALVLELPLKLVADPTSGKALEVTLVNGLTGL